MKNFLFLLSLFSFTACTVGPDYSRPHLPTPKSYPESIDSTQKISVKWWKDLEDSTLNQLMQKALKVNTDLRLAAARVEEAQAGLDDVAGAQFPEIDANAGYNKNRISAQGYSSISPTNGRTRPLYRGGLSTIFELDFWGKLRRAEEGARAQLLAAREAKQQVQLALTTSVVRAYTALRLADSQMSAVSEIKSVRDEELRIVTEKFKVGSASAADVAQAQVNQANAITVLSETTRIRAQALHLLGSLMGEPGLTLNPIATPTVPVPPIPAAGLPSDLLRQRPDVVAAEQNLIAANARIGYAKAAYFPTFSLTGALGLESREFSAFTNSASSTSSLGVDLRVPLLDFGRTTARVDAAIALQHQAAANYEKTVLQAFREVRDALVDVRETSLAAQAAEQREIAARESFRVAENRYQQGQMTPFDFLSARRLLAESQSAVAKVRADRVGAHLDLIKALGVSVVAEIESVAEIE